MAQILNNLNFKNLIGSLRGKAQPVAPKPAAPDTYVRVKLDPQVVSAKLVTVPDAARPVRLQLRDNKTTQVKLQLTVDNDQPLPPPSWSQRVAAGLKSLKAQVGGTLQSASGGLRAAWGKLGRALWSAYCGVSGLFAERDELPFATLSSRKLAREFADKPATKSVSI